MEHYIRRFKEKNYFKLDLDELGKAEESDMIFPLIKFIVTGNTEEKIKAVRYIRDLAYLYEEECSISIPYLISILADDNVILRREVLKSLLNFNLEDDTLLILYKVSYIEDDLNNIKIYNKIFKNYNITIDNNKNKVVETTQEEEFEWEENTEELERFNEMWDYFHNKSFYEYSFDEFIEWIIGSADYEIINKNTEEVIGYEVVLDEEQGYKLRYRINEDTFYLFYENMEDEEFSIEVGRDNSGLEDICEELYNFGIIS